MSSGDSSEQSTGVGNSQLSCENYECSNKLKELQEKMFNSNLTDAQRSTLNTIMNTINQHLTDEDYSGVERDLEGNPVPNGHGGFFDHIHEMKDSYRSLVKAKRSLEGSLKNPNLEIVERTLLEEGLSKTNEHVNRIDKLFEQYGGIDKWKKK